VCTVDGCGKCFHRGEHLKRHIRSIHTHEKRTFLYLPAALVVTLLMPLAFFPTSAAFKCTFPLCQKYFNRHDNLLQHLKVHRDPESKAKVPAQKSGPEPRYASTSTSSPPAEPRERSFSPADEPESPVGPVSAPRTIYNAFPRTAYNPYQSLSAAESYAPHNPIHLLASMAVSSLRTELPQSPVDPRGSALRSSLY